MGAVMKGILIVCVVLLTQACGASGSGSTNIGPLCGWDRVPAGAVCDDAETFVLYLHNGDMTECEGMPGAGKSLQAREYSWVFEDRCMPFVCHAPGLPANELPPSWDCEDPYTCPHETCATNEDCTGDQVCF